MTTRRELSFMMVFGTDLLDLDDTSFIIELLFTAQVAHFSRNFAALKTPMVMNARTLLP